MSYQVIQETALEAGFPPVLSSLIAAQAAHETGNFTSRFYREFNNAFGYSYYPGSKWQLPSPGDIADNGAPIAAYRSIQDSTGEIIDWIKRRQKEGKFPGDLSTITTPAQYAELLKKAGYYEDKLENYSRGLATWYKPVAIAAGAAIGFLVLSYLAYTLYMQNQKN